MTNEEAAAILESEAEYLYSQDEPYNRQAFYMAIEALKERKKGKWIYHIDDLFPAESTKECDQCRTHQDLNCDGNFCPWCGAKMEE